MSEISITIKGVDGETATLTGPSDLPLSSVTASIQSALEKCSASAVRQEERPLHQLQKGEEAPHNLHRL